MATVEDQLPPGASPVMAAKGELPDPRRRDFINVAAVAFAGVGAVAIVYPLINQMGPAADVLAQSARLGFMPSYPTFNWNPLDLGDAVKASGQTPGDFLGDQLEAALLNQVDSPVYIWFATKDGVELLREPWTISIAFQNDFGDF